MATAAGEADIDAHSAVNGDGEDPHPAEFGVFGTSHFGLRCVKSRRDFLKSTSKEYRLPVLFIECMCLRLSLVYLFSLVGEATVVNARVQWLLSLSPYFCQKNCSCFVTLCL